MAAVSGVALDFRREADEEQGHAAKLICHLLSLGLAPNGSRLKPVRQGRDLEEMLRLDWQFELDAVRLYQDALHYAERCRDGAAAALFAELLADEEGHLAEIERMLRDLAEKGCDPDRFVKEVCHG